MLNAVEITEHELSTRRCIAMTDKENTNIIAIFALFSFQNHRTGTDIDGSTGGGGGLGYHGYLHNNPADFK